MERSVSVEEFLGGLLRLNRSGSVKMGGLGPRSDSEAAFHEFLKRIPSATALSGQLDDKTGFFGSSHSLFNFGGASASGDANMHRVTSLDMLRTYEGAARSHTEAKGTEQPGSSPVGQSPQQKLFQPSQKGDGDATERSAAMPVSDPHSARHVQPNVQGGAQAFPHPGMPGMQLPVPAMSYDPNVLHSPLLTQAQDIRATQPADTGTLDEDDSPPATANKRSTGRSAAAASASNKDDSDKLSERRARRMLSNRESARRSRRRKQEQLQELEAKIQALEQRNASLEAHCQSVSARVQKLLDAKQELENENQHLTSLFEQLQRSLGKETIRMHLPVALGGVGTAPSQRADATATLDTSNLAGGSEGVDAAGGGRLKRDAHHNGEGDSAAKLRRTSASKGNGSGGR